MIENCTWRLIVGSSIPVTNMARRHKAMLQCPLFAFRCIIDFFSRRILSTGEPSQTFPIEDGSFFIQSRALVGDVMSKEGYSHWKHSISLMEKFVLPTYPCKLQFSPDVASFSFLDTDLLRPSRPKPKPRSRIRVIKPILSQSSKHILLEKWNANSV